MPSHSFSPAVINDDTPARAILDEFGPDVFKTLQTHFGGQDVSWPAYSQRLKDDHPLVVAVGRDTAGRLVRMFAGERFYMPRGRQPIASLGRVAKEARAGTPTQVIAAKVGLSARQVRRLKQRARELAAFDPMMIAAE